MAARAEILSKVIDVITQVTLTDKSSVTERSQLFDDLGVESIDFIDIIYNLETEFGVEIASDDVFTDRDFFSSESGNWDGKHLNAQGNAALEQFTYLNRARIDGPHPQEYLYSVEMIVDFIEHRLRPSS